MPAELGPEDAPHPRERDVLLGRQGAVAAFAEAIGSGRLHHAWLIGGPRGIGKATLAYRVARRLLASPAERSATDPLGVDPAGRTARQVAAGSHPNLLAIELPTEGEGGKAAPKAIPIEAVRRTTAFFGQTAADGGRRVCIVDSADELTVAGANALLKTVEEPPPHSLVLILSHAPQRVLPTIRSRCRKLNLPPLDEGTVVRALRSLGPDFAALPDEVAAKAAAASEGSPGRALALLDPSRLQLLDEVAGLLARLPNAPAGRVLALAERLADRKRAGDAALAVDRILRWLGDEVARRRGEGAARLAPLAAACEALTEAAATADAYNLDRRAFVVTLFDDLAEAVRRAA